MKRLQKFIGRQVDIEKVKDQQVLVAAGVTDRWVPDEPDVFDELEFGLGTWNGKAVIFTMVLEHGRLARISVGHIAEGGTEDDMVAFSEAELAALMAEKGAGLAAFFTAVLRDA